MGRDYIVIIIGDGTETHGSVHDAQDVRRLAVYLAATHSE